MRSVWEHYKVFQGFRLNLRTNIREIIIFGSIWTSFKVYTGSIFWGSCWGSSKKLARVLIQTVSQVMLVQIPDSQCSIKNRSYLVNFYRAYPYLVHQVQKPMVLKPLYSKIYMLPKIFMASRVSCLLGCFPNPGCLSKTYVIWFNGACYFLCNLNMSLSFLQL